MGARHGWVNRRSNASPSSEIRGLFEEAERNDRLDAVDGRIRGIGHPVFFSVRRDDFDKIRGDSLRSSFEDDRLRGLLGRDDAVGASREIARLDRRLAGTEVEPAIDPLLALMRGPRVCAADR